MRKLIYFILFLAAPVLSGEGNKTKNQPSLTVLLRERHIDSTKLEIRIYKTARRLDMVYKEESLKSYPVVLGFNPTDDKMREGDGCTPEGVFHIRDQYPHQYWSKFMWIDYPTSESWKKFAKNKADGNIPQDATIGGEVGIHGVPNGMDFLITTHSNWTHGCISLHTSDVEEVFRYAHKGTVVRIYH